MRKLLILSMALVLVGGSIMAQGLGLTAGLDFNVGILNPEKGDAVDDMGIRPSIAYENDSLVDNLTIYAGLGFSFMIGHDDRVYKDMPMGFDIDVGAYYQLDISSSSYVTFGLRNFNAVGIGDYGYVQPRAGAGLNSPALPVGGAWRTDDKDMGSVLSYLNPTAYFTQGIGGIGEFYAGAELPYLLTTDWSHMNMALVAGINLDFGLGVELVVWNTPFVSDKAIRKAVDRMDAHWINYIELIPSYTYDFLYAELAIGMPMYKDGMKEEGLTLVPEVQIQVPTLSALSLYANMPFYYVGSDKKKGGDDVRVGFGLGARFSF